MAAKRVIIVGGGFAGLAAARRLRSLDAEVVLIDPRGGGHFLPVLPDLISRDLPPGCLVYPHARAAARWGCRVVRDRVVAADLAGRTVRTPSEALEYDALLLTCGARTNFHGQDAMRRASLTIENVPDALAIRAAAERPEVATFVVAGGGYTGVEVATHLWRLGRRTGRPPRIVIAELLGELCKATPAAQGCVWRQLARLGIEVRLETTVDAVEGDRIRLTSGESFDRARLVWTAGMRTDDFVFDVDAARTKQGRLWVDEFLRVDERCFAAGDVAAVDRGDKAPRRMSVQNALQGGRAAAGNIRRLLAGRPPERFGPYDPGYVVPLANMRGCGRIMGIRAGGVVPSLLHYLLSVTFSVGGRNRAELAAGILPGLYSPKGPTAWPPWPCR
jgi:NADH dehydrogenase